MRLSVNKSGFGLMVGLAALAAVPALADDSRPALWTGAYIGLNAGFGTSNFNVPAGNTSFNTSGALGGVHGGYNWQTGAFVLGVEADYDAASLGKTTTSNGVTAKMNVSALASVRARAGVAFNRALLFATLGYGWTPASMTFVNPAAGSISNTNSGVVFGGGLEYKFTRNFSLRGEVLHYNSTGNWNVGAGTSAKLNTPANAFRAGASYHF